MGAMGSMGIQSLRDRLRQQFAVTQDHDEPLVTVGSGQPGDYGGPRWSKPPTPQKPLAPLGWWEWAVNRRFDNMNAGEGAGNPNGLPIPPGVNAAGPANGADLMAADDPRRQMQEDWNTKKPWNFVPRAPKPPRQLMGPLGAAGDLVSQGHLGFAGQIQGAMDRMLDVNLANQQASVRNRQTAGNFASSFWGPVMVEKLRLEQERLRQEQESARESAREQARFAALAAILGGGGGGGKSNGRPRMTSNIGQGINANG